MKIFEIHITGYEDINAEFDALGIKNIIVELLKPNKEILRVEHMSSFVMKKKNYEDCLQEVKNLCRNLKSEIIRIKIECPVYDDYIDKSIYIESHFTPEDNNYPISRNKKSGKLMGTDRVYKLEEYPAFIEKWKGFDKELCLFDTYVEEDSDWFELY